MLFSSTYIFTKDLLVEFTPFIQFQLMNTHIFLMNVNNIVMNIDITNLY